MNLMHFAFSLSEAPDRETPVSKGPVRRGRNPKMDALLRKVNGSARYSVASLEEQTHKALGKRKP